MSIIISDLTFHYHYQSSLFSHLNFSVTTPEKVAVVGHNGSGKSTLLRLMAGLLPANSGSILSDFPPYYIPQHTGSLHQTVAQAMRISDKLTALNAILHGSVAQSDYDTLADDWEIESRCQSALEYWQITHIQLDMPIDDLSGGEKTKVFLAGLLIHHPEIILLDEPSNHLDATGRKLLYQYIEQSKATIIVVSHDITLLNNLPVTYELSEKGLKRYGGNYDFYAEQKAIEINALNAGIHAEEKALRLAREKAREVAERQQKQETRGAKQQKKESTGKAMMDKLKNDAENSTSRLKGVHTEKVGAISQELSEMRKGLSALKDLKIDFDNASLHSGKLLIEAQAINFAYQSNQFLWKTPLYFNLYSNDRIQILGDNGTGKTTFIKLLIGLFTPACGKIKRADFRWIYLDQDYSQVDVNCTVIELAEQYNKNNLPEHEVRLRLNRFLFTSDTLDKSCKSLSGGEKMRLYLCCLMISNQTPDLIILDEPTNNLDIASLQVLTQTIKHYQGSLLVISHDNYFVKEIGCNVTYSLSTISQTNPREIVRRQ